ncbi:MAG: amidohydrolase family protein [Pseudomonadota bacterium]
MIRDVLIPKALMRDPTGTPHGECLRGDAIVQDGRVVALTPAPPSDTPRMLIPGLAEAHCHLDKCHTIHRLGPVGGDLRSAIAAQTEDKANWTEADLHARATRGLAEAQDAGCTTLRSHVDWGDGPQPPLAWSVLTQLDVQCAALLGIDQLADPDFAAALAPHVKDHVLGAFILDHGQIHEGLENTFALAAKHGLPLDFHVDEGLGDLNGLEAIADTALATGFDGPILCGHAVALMDKASQDVARIADKCARAGVTICALPTTNLYLQGRTDGTPDRRGITRLAELRRAGVPIIVGSDNVGDAFCPTGQHDPMAALHLAHLTAHLDPPLGDLLPMITTDARTAMGLAPVYADDAPLDALRLSDATHPADLIAGRAPLRPATEDLL